MQLGDHERELLAELRDMPSFVLLLSIFKEFEEDVLCELSLSKKEDELVRITRFYQVLRALRSFLESRPEAAVDEIKRIKETYFPADIQEMTQDELFRKRFNPDVTNTE